MKFAIRGHVSKSLLQDEDAEQAACVQHLMKNYPSVLFYGNSTANIFNSGWGEMRAGEDPQSFKRRKAEAGAQIYKIKKTQDLGGHSSWPDLQIVAYGHKNFWKEIGLPIPPLGLFIEIKKEGRSVYLKRSHGLIADERLNNQAETLAGLNKSGAFACFAVGHKEAIPLIDFYLTGERKGISITPFETSCGLIYRINNIAE